MKQWHSFGFLLSTTHKNLLSHFVDLTATFLLLIMGNLRVGSHVSTDFQENQSWRSTFANGGHKDNMVTSLVWGCSFIEGKWIKNRNKNLLSLTHLTLSYVYWQYTDCASNCSCNITLHTSHFLMFTDSTLTVPQTAVVTSPYTPHTFLCLLTVHWLCLELQL
jgi:hypothetical protein